MSSYSILPLISALVFISLGLFVYLKNRHSAVNALFALSCLATFGWQFTWAILFSIEHEALAPWLVKMGYTSITLIPTLAYHFAILHIGANGEVMERRIIRLSYLFCSAMLLMLWFTSLFIRGYKPHVWGNYPVAGPLHPLYLTHLTFLAVRVLYRLWKDAGDLSLPALMRMQRKYLFWAFSIYCLASLDFLVNYGADFYPFGFVFVLASLGILFYTIVQYRLMDIRVAIVRGATFLFVYVPLLFLPIIGGVILRTALERWLGFNWWILPALLAAVLAVGGLGVYRWMTQRAEERLLADQRRYQQLLVAAAEGMLTVLDLRKLLRRIVGAVVKYVGLTYAAIYLQEEPEGPYRFQVCRGRRLEFPETFDSEDVLVHYLQAAKAPVVVEELRRHVREAHAEYLTHLCDRLTQLKASVIVPAIFETPLKKRLIGFMFLGEKSSQAMFTSDDLSTFWNLAHVAAIAIRTARLHRRVVDIETLEATGELYSVVNHELGNVQHIISMQIGYLKEKAKNGELSYEEMTTVLNRAEETAVRGHTIIEDGKSYRKQSGQPGIQPFSMGDLLRDTAQALQKRFSTCPGITLKLDIPAGLPFVEGRATLASLPLSLLSISYWALAGVPEPSGTISISVRENKPEAKVEIRTSDTGTSLRNLMDNPKEIGGGKMFPHRGKHGGLYFFLVRKIVAEHNGTFTVMDGSEPGEGAVLIVRIPLKYTPPPEEEADEETIGSAA